MAYKLLLTATYQQKYYAALDYIVYELRNTEAAKHLADDVDAVYAQLAATPYMYSISHDQFLAARGYRQAPIKGYNITYTVAEDTHTVYLLGFSHQRQDQVHALL